MCMCVYTCVCAHVCPGAEGGLQSYLPKADPNRQAEDGGENICPSMVTTAVPTPQQLSPARYPSLQRRPSLSPLKKPRQEW